MRIRKPLSGPVTGDAEGPKEVVVTALGMIVVGALAGADYSLLLLHLRQQFGHELS